MASVSYRKADNENRTEQHVQQADNITRHGFRQEIEKKKKMKKNSKPVFHLRKILPLF